MKQIQYHASQKRVKISATDPMIELSTHLSLHTRSGEGSQRAGLTKTILKRLYNSWERQAGTSRDFVSMSPEIAGNALQGSPAMGHV